MASWFSFPFLAGVLATVAFAALCHHSLKWGVLALTAAGCVRGVQLGAFSGQETVQGLLPIEVFATVLFGAWCVQQATRHRPRRRARLDRPLLLLIPWSVLSLVLGFVWFDSSIPLEHMKLSVSIGQILLTAWPMATYVVVANAVNEQITLAQIKNLIVALSLPSLLLVGSLQMWTYVAWSVAFALPASSFCCVDAFETRSWGRRAFLLFVTFAPVIYGVRMGKAFYYSYVVVSAAVITLLRARQMVVAGIPIVLAAYVIAVPVMSGSMTPTFVEQLVEHEEEDQSLGGRGGRDQLIVDGLGIWSRSPLFGVGPGNNYPYMLKYSSLGTAHNQYVNLLIELGLVGLVLFVWFSCEAVRLGLRLLRTARAPANRSLALAWLGLFAGMLAGGFFGDFMLPSIRNSGLELFAEFYVQWVVLGMVVSATALERTYSTFQFQAAAL